MRGAGPGRSREAPQEEKVPPRLLLIEGRPA